jgi:hypothetical protein
LLSGKIGTNPRAVAEGESTLWEAMSELHTELKILGQAANGLPKELKGVMNDLERQNVDFQWLDTNMTKMYKHYKWYLTSSNARMISLEQSREPRTSSTCPWPKFEKESSTLENKRKNPWLSFEEKFKN